MAAIVDLIKTESEMAKPTKDDTPSVLKNLYVRELLRRLRIETYLKVARAIR